MTAPKGYPSQEKEDRIKAQFQTINRVSPGRYGAEVWSHQTFERFVIGDTVDAIASNGYQITAAAHAARPGDLIRFTSGLASGLEVRVESVSTNVITLAESFAGSALSAYAPVATNTFDILRPRSGTVDSNGNISIAVASTTDMSETVYHDYSATPVTTAAWQQVVAATANTSVKMQIFDSSGSLLELGVGAAAAEVREFLITPGGNGVIEVQIAAGSRLSVRAIDATADAGFLAINIFRG